MTDLGPQPGRDDAEDPSASDARISGRGDDGPEAMQTFVLHVGFLADGEMCARHQAQAYVESLNLVRPEVDCYTAEVSCGLAPARRVFCGSPGPDPLDVCVDTAGHSGLHHGPGHTRQWDEHDVPRAPNDLGGIG